LFGRTCGPVAGCPSHCQPDAAFPWLVEHVIREQELLAVARLDELPPEAARDREGFERGQVRSGAMIAMVVEGRAVGYLSFLEARSWGERHPSLRPLFAHAQALRYLCMADGITDCLNRAPQPRLRELGVLTPRLFLELQRCRLRVVYRLDKTFAWLHRATPSQALGLVSHEPSERLARGGFDYLPPAEARQGIGAA
jgi:hypothetical protein